MQIDFSVSGVPVQFIRDNFFGTAEIRTPDGTIPLQKHLQISTHFSLSLTKTWKVTISGVEVRIEKTRPLVLPWLRANTYRVFAGDKLLVEKSGQ